MKIIALETSTQPGSIAALEEQVIYEKGLPSTKKSAESFASELQLALDANGWDSKQVDCMAVCEGPGSFTGLRIGITVAKTFAYVTGAKVVAVGTMRVLARQAKLSANAECWCLIDAQRGELFTALYRNSSEGLVEVEPTSIQTPEAWIKKLQPGQVIIGEGLNHIKSVVPTDMCVADESLWCPSAKALAECGAELVGSGNTVDPWKLVPQYYRKSAAEEKAAKKLVDKVK